MDLFYIVKNCKDKPNSLDNRVYNINLQNMYIYIYIFFVKDDNIYIFFCKG